MLEWVADTSEIPAGAHALALHASPDEAARNMAGLLRGAHFLNQPAAVYSNDDGRLARYRSAIGLDQPWMASALHRIPGPHVERTAEGLRPLPAALSFAADHPGGVTLAGDTLPGLLTRANLEEILRYEAWFDTLRPYPHRALCPYDLAALEADRASTVLSSLAVHHTHVVLSEDPGPATRLLQLVLLPHLSDPPAPVQASFDRGLARGLIRWDEGDRSVHLTSRGQLALRALREFPRRPSEPVPLITGT